MTTGNNARQNAKMPTTRGGERKHGGFAFPPSIVILFILLVVVALMTYLVPAGEYDRIVNERTGQTAVVPGSYHHVESSPVGPFGLFVKLVEGFVNAADVIFLIMFAACWIYSILRGGAFDSGIKLLLRNTMGREHVIIPIFFFVFALAGATYGEFETVYGLIPLFVGLATAIGWDPIVGLGMSFVAVCCGFASGVYNPFTVGIAHKYAELPLFSGGEFRWLSFLVLCSINCWWVMRYAKKIKKNPAKSFVADLDYSDITFNAEDAHSTEMTAMHKFQLLLLVATVGVIVYGTLNFDWYLSEVSGIFLVMFLVNELLNRRSMEQIADDLYSDCALMVPAFLIVGFSRGVLQIMMAGKIVDTVIFTLNAPLVGLPAWAAAEGMLVVQNLVNFFIPSGSGQAAAIMPIMVPLADLSNVTRQVAVLAYHFGDGFSNLVWPTCGVAVACGIAKVPLDRWWRFYLPGFALTFAAQGALIALAVAIGYN